MSDLNDDILNDELDDELDDQALLGADEDDLLLSDEELEKDVSSETKAQLKDDAEKWVNSQLNVDKEKCQNQNEEKRIEDIVTTSTCNSDVSPQSTSKESDVNVHVESDVSTSDESPTKPLVIKYESKLQLLDHQSKNDEVTSTNKEIEDALIPNPPENSSCTSALKIQEVDAISAGAGIIQSSQESTSATEEASSDPREDVEDRAERTNIKQTVERSDHVDSSPEKYQPARYFPPKRGRGVGLRGHYSSVRPPRHPYTNYPQYPQHPNENANPQYFPYNPMDPSLNARPPFSQNNPIGPRIEYRPAIVPTYRAQNPSDFPVYRGPRPEFPNHVSGGPFNNFNLQNPVRPMYRPEGNVPMQQQRFDIRGRMPVPRQPGFPVQNNPGYIPSSISAPHSNPMQQVPQHPANMSIIVAPPGPGPAQPQSVIPRKVLINPNFKGGLEAVKSQLMKDTQFMQTISPHVSHLQSDEELLRQQEEFINKNRLHIEKRRHERSPDRRRSRERSYSPPRRERRGDSREKRGDSRDRRRRAGSRELEYRDIPKRRRSGSPVRRLDKERLQEEEDEETRAYRLEIEKQKAMREKILRDKELRRRKAIEGKNFDEKSITDEAPQKLTPVVVTGRKIISLKKKSDAASQALIKTTKSTSPQTQQQTIQRTIPTAKILPETKRTVTDHTVKDASTGTSTTSLAVIKPVVKKTITVQTDISKDTLLDDDELLDEELLLADTPSPPSSPKSLKSVGLTLSEKTVSCNSSGNTFTSNRRVIIKSSKDSQESQEIRKGVFDRLEKKIGVNESVKRKIQRIVIKNAE